MTKTTKREPWPKCSGSSFDGACRSVVSPAGVVAEGQRAVPHESGLCSHHLRQQREAEEAIAAGVTEEEDDSESLGVFAGIEWEDSPEDAALTFRQRLRRDSEHPDFYPALRASLISGLSASKGISKTCRCGKTVNVRLPDSAAITRAARDLLQELEGIERDSLPGQVKALQGKAIDDDTTDAELELLLAHSGVNVRPISSESIVQLAREVLRDHEEAQVSAGA